MYMCIFIYIYTCLCVCMHACQRLRGSVLTVYVYAIFDIRFHRGHHLHLAYHCQGRGSSMDSQWLLASPQGAQSPLRDRPPRISRMISGVLLYYRGLCRLAGPELELKPSQTKLWVLMVYYSRRANFKDTRTCGGVAVWGTYTALEEERFLKAWGGRLPVICFGRLLR